MDNQDSEKLENITDPIGPATDGIHNQKQEEEIQSIGDLGESQQPTEIEIPHSDDTVENELKNMDMAGDEIDPSSQSSSPDENVLNETKKSSFWGRLLFDIIFFVVVSLLVFVLPSSLQKMAVSITLMSAPKLTGDDADFTDAKTKLEKRISELDKMMDAYIPKNGYIIVNSIDNEFTLMNGHNLVRIGKCSTGSMVQLEDDKRGKSFIFQTPKGVRKVLRKKTDPVWKRPDWAYIDDGLPIPSPNDPSRIEEGVLGDYALELGNGYMIHGTLWQRYLGLAVTHGCIRLNDDDLKAVYTTLEKGSNVYIY